MIEKASELLETFIKYETDRLENFKMPHMPTLGAAYEEITKQGLYKDFSIPKNLDLRVVSGFVSVGGVMLPEQIDCMLVHGEGEKYSLTDQFIYDINKILCIFEIKKSLTKSDFIDAFDHLGKIRSEFANNFETRLQDKTFEPNIRAASQVFSQITGKAAPATYSGIRFLTNSDAILFYTLVQETLAPISIIQGYGGYKTENGLRTALVDILESKKLKNCNGVGISNIPSLITSNKYSIVKANGIPYLTVREDSEWVALLSARHNPVRIILETLWSKISLHFGVEMPWDDGLYIENLHPLLIAKTIETEDSAGWLYEVLEFKEKALNRDETRVWEPTRLVKSEAFALSKMSFFGGYFSTDGESDAYFKCKFGVSIDEVSESLIKSRLFMKSGNYLRPVFSQTHYLTTDNGDTFVSNEREKFDLWCKENGVQPNYITILFIE